MSTKSVIATAVIAGITGIAIGVAGQPTADPKVIEKEVPVEKTVEVEKIVEKDVTPTACLTALDEAEVAFGIAGDGFNQVAVMIDAIFESDVAAMETASDEFAEAADGINPVADRYNAAAAKCRATR